MKSKLKTMLVLLVCVMIIGILSNPVKAEYSAEIKMTPDKTEVKPGDTVNIVVDLVNIVDAGTGASEMSGNMEYDKDFFESITATQGNFMMGKDNFVLSGNILTQDGQFAVLQLKISDKAKGSANFKFTDLITANGGTVEPSSPDITLKFNIPDGDDGDDGDNEKNETNTNGTNNVNNNNSGADRNNSKNNDSIIKNNNIKGNNISPKSQLPKTGVGKGIVIAGITLLVIGIASYVLYKKYNKI